MTATLTGAAMADDPPSAHPTVETTSHAQGDDQACWTEYELGKRVCSESENELKTLVARKYDRIIVTDAAEYQNAVKAGIYHGVLLKEGTFASYEIGKLFRNKDYGGSVGIYTTSNATTCYGQTYTFNFASVTYNDSTSSFYGQNAYQVRLYEDINFGGPFYGYFDCRSNLADVGFNDRASSVSFHLTSTYSCY